MWNCIKCNEDNEDNFDACWKCGNEKNSDQQEINNTVNEEAQNNSKILFGDTSTKSEAVESEKNQVVVERDNLFQGRTEAQEANSKFPDWDIVPPNQIINPRIKVQ